MRLRAVTAVAAASSLLVLILAGCDDSGSQITAPPAVGNGAEAPDERVVSASMDGFLAAGSARRRSFPATAFSGDEASGTEGATVEDLGCFFVGSQFGPNRGSDVFCDTIHTFEKYGAITMDETWPADFEAYTPGTEDYERWTAWADGHCANLLAEANQTDAVAAALGVDSPVLPYWTGWYGYQIPKDLWDTGTRVTHCWVSSNDEFVTGRWVSNLMTADKPDEISLCYRKIDSQTVDQVTCSEPHFLETVFIVDSLSALGQDFVDNLDPAARTEEQRLAMDSFCQRSEAQVIGTLRDDLKIRSSVSPESWGVDGQYFVFCGIAPEDVTQQVTGSSIGLGDGELVLTPRPA